MVQRRRHSLADKSTAHPWLTDNIYLTRGYRKDFDSVWLSLRSLFMVHNEIMNIWTHLLGAILFIVVLVFAVQHYDGSKTTHEAVKGSLKTTEAFQEMNVHYEENLKLMMDLVNGRIKHQTEAEAGPGSGNSQMKSTLLKIVDKYALSMEKLGRELHKDKVALINNVNSSLEYLTERVSKTMQVIMAKYDVFLRSDVLDLKLLYDKIERCFHYDTIGDSLASHVHPHLEYYPIVIYVLCAFGCLGFSAIFHTFTSMSYKVHKILHRLDMAGISILNFGSSFSMFYYAFYCRPAVMAAYTAVLLVACLTVFFVSLGDKIHELRYVKYKGMMFAFLGLSNGIPFTHLCVLGLYAAPDNDILPFNLVFIGLCLMGILYLTGLTFYVMKFPEKYYPLKFDIWLNSHVIWHIFVMCAAAEHFFNVTYIYKIRKDIQCVSC